MDNDIEVTYTLMKYMYTEILQLNNYIVRSYRYVIVVNNTATRRTNNTAASKEHQ